MAPLFVFNGPELKGNGGETKAAKKLKLGIDALRYRMKKFGFL